MSSMFNINITYPAIWVLIANCWHYRYVFSFQISIWSQPDTFDQTAYALEFAEKAYDFFAKYFGTPEVVPKAGEIQTRL